MVLLKQLHFKVGPFRENFVHFVRQEENLSLALKIKSKDVDSICCRIQETFELDEQCDLSTAWTEGSKELTVCPHVSATRSVAVASFDESHCSRCFVVGGINPEKL